MKKTLAIMLALIMVLAMIPALAETEPTETINIPVTKEWNHTGNEGDKPTEVTVKLLANNQDTNRTITLNATNSWSGAFNSMPVSDDNGIIAYTVMEVPIPNYEAAYTQPQPEQVTVGKWGEKITPASTPTYTVTGNIIVANKGGKYYVWTKDNLSNAQKPKLLAAINAVGLGGLGKALTVGNTVFQSGIPATFNNGNVNIDNVGDDTKITFKETNAWSLFYEGTLTIKEATGAIITNTYTPTPNPDPDPSSDTGSLTISKTVENLPNDKLPTRFTFEIMQGNNIIQQVTAKREGSDNTYKSETVQLPYGTYTINEVDADVDGYTLATEINPNTITIDEIKKRVEVYVTNTYTEAEPKKGELTISKSANGLPDEKLPDSFTFEIMQGNNIIQQVTAKREGSDNTYKSETVQLPYGTYTINEVGADVNGFKLNPTGLGEVTIGKEHKKVTVNVTNAYEPLPPNTGNGGGYWHPTTTPVPVIVIPPKTGDMTVWQSILHFLGIR